MLYIFIHVYVCCLHWIVWIWSRGLCFRSLAMDFVVIFGTCPAGWSLLFRASSRFSADLCSGPFEVVIWSNSIELSSLLSRQYSCFHSPQARVKAGIPGCNHEKNVENLVYDLKNVFEYCRNQSLKIIKNHWFLYEKRCRNAGLKKGIFRWGFSLFFYCWVHDWRHLERKHQ